MSENGSIFLTKRSLITTLIISLLIGLVCAIFVVKESDSYVAQVNFTWMILSVLVPIFVVLLISATLAAVIHEFKFTTLLLISCLLIPFSYIVFIKIFEITKIAAYSR